MEGHDIYSAIRYIPMIGAFAVGRQLPSYQVMTHHSNAAAGGGWYLFSSKFVRPKVR